MIPPAARARLEARFGSRVGPWWEALPAVLDALAARWALALGEAVDRGNTSLVIRCRRADGRAGVLKLTPEASLAAAEARALAAWTASRRVPDVWERDDALGALLLEAIPAEATVAERGEAPPLDDIAALLRELQAGAADGFPPLTERVEFVFAHWIERRAGTPVVPRLERGWTVARELAAGGARATLLHGDLHPGNVLDGGAERGLVAIDPRPCVGDPAFDAVDWVLLGAPAGWPARNRRLAAAIDADAERLWRWSAAFAAMIAASKQARGAPAAEVDALLALAP